MKFEAPVKNDRWMIASSLIEFGPHVDEGLARKAAERLNASNLRRMLTGSASPSPLAHDTGKSSRRLRGATA